MVGKFGICQHRAAIFVEISLFLAKICLYLWIHKIKSPSGQCYKGSMIKYFASKVVVTRKL